VKRFFGIFANLRPEQTMRSNLVEILIIKIAPGYAAV
jgi:hypothetical protein